MPAPRRTRPAVWVSLALLLTAGVAAWWLAVGTHPLWLPGPAKTSFVVFEGVIRSYGLEGYKLNINHAFPSSRFRLWSNFGKQSTCHELAQNSPEPYTGAYKRRRKPQPLPGGVPRSYFRWPGTISRAEFDAVRKDIRGPGCTHCMFTVRYKYFGGKLYIRKSDNQPPKADDQPREGVWWHVDVAEELLLASLTVFEVPDVDFILHFGDGCPTGPIINWCVCRHKIKAGFTYPSYGAWTSALGPSALQELYACYEERYPQKSKEPVVFWRGSTTDVNHDGFSLGNWRNAPRINLHIDGRKHRDWFDVRLSDIISTDDKVIRESLADTASQVPFEDLQNHAILLDMDGNGWSDRFARLAHLNSPIIKQASNYTAYFEHLMAPGHNLEYFSNDVSDALARSRVVLDEWKRDPSRLLRQAQQRQGLAELVLSNLGQMEAMAYTLQVVSERQEWVTTAEPGYALVSTTLCCRYGGLPRGMVKAIKARQAAP